MAKTHQNLQNLKPFAGIGVADPRHEQAEGEGQHQDVQHEVLLVALCFRARKTECDGSGRNAPAIRALPVSDREVPLHAYVFEADAQTIL